MRLTENHYKYFVRCCRKWSKRLASDYTFTYKFGVGDDMKNSLACVRCSKVASMAVVELNDKWNEKYHYPSKRMLDKVAMHEVCHVMLNDMTTDMALYYNDDLVGEVEHKVIHKLTNWYFD